LEGNIKADLIETLRDDVISRTALDLEYMARLDVFEHVTNIRVW